MSEIESSLTGANVHLYIYIYIYIHIYISCPSASEEYMRISLLYDNFSTFDYTACYQCVFGLILKIISIFFLFSPIIKKESTKFTFITLLDCAVFN